MIQFNHNASWNKQHRLQAVISNSEDLLSRMETPNFTYHFEKNKFDILAYGTGLTKHITSVLDEEEACMITHVLSHIHKSPSAPRNRYNPRNVVAITSWTTKRDYLKPILGIGSGFYSKEEIIEAFNKFVGGRSVQPTLVTAWQKQLNQCANPADVYDYLYAVVTMNNELSK